MGLSPWSFDSLWISYPLGRKEVAKFWLHWSSVSYFSDHFLSEHFWDLVAMATTFTMTTNSSLIKQRITFAMCCANPFGFYQYWQSLMSGNQDGILILAEMTVVSYLM